MPGPDESKAVVPIAGLDDLTIISMNFSQTLPRLIDAKARRMEVINAPTLTESCFPKSEPEGIHPANARLLPCCGLELNLRETEDLVETTGYTLSHSYKFDVIVEYLSLVENTISLRLMRCCFNMTTLLGWVK